MDHLRKNWIAVAAAIIVVVSAVVMYYPWPERPGHSEYSRQNLALSNIFSILNHAIFAGLALYGIQLGVFMCFTASILFLGMLIAGIVVSDGPPVVGWQAIAIFGSLSSLYLGLFGLRLRREKQKEKSRALTQE